MSVFDFLSPEKLLASFGVKPEEIVAAATQFQAEVSAAKTGARDAAAHFNRQQNQSVSSPLAQGAKRTRQ